MLAGRDDQGSARRVRRHVAEMRPTPRKEAYLRMNPLIAEQAQIDWAHVGSVNVAGGKRSLWLFVIVLAWSRAQWGEFVFDLSAHSLLRSLIRAAEFFGGTCARRIRKDASSAPFAGGANGFSPVAISLASSTAIVSSWSFYKPSHSIPLTRRLQGKPSAHPWIKSAR